MAGAGTGIWRGTAFFSKAATIFSAARVSWSTFCSSCVAQAGSADEDKDRDGEVAVTCAILGETDKEATG